MSEPFNLGPSMVKLSATTTSSSIALPQTGQTVLIKNEGTVTVFIATGVDSATAVLDVSMPVLSGCVEAFTMPSRHNYIAAITRSGTATVYVIRSDGQ